MRKDVTIIYYTANREHENFESKIRMEIKESSIRHGIPIVSVSQKPLPDFGKNICVGKKPYNSVSALRQLLIGLKEAKTTFALAAESDVLYPPEYFTFIPPTNDNFYVYFNVWILYAWIGPRNKGLFWKKRFTEGAIMCDRKHWIKEIEIALNGVGEWSDNPKHHPRTFFSNDNLSWTSENPVISIKTMQGQRRYTATSAVTAETLPFWGSPKEVKKFLNL